MPRLFLLLSLVATARIFAAPEQLAREAVEQFRDKKQRGKSEVIWPSAGIAKPPGLGAEVFLLEGYINYTCTRIFWREKDALVQRVKMGRTWFYNPKGEFYETEQFTVPAAQFREAWEAAQLVQAATLKVASPPVRKEGWPITTGWGGFSSHAHHYYARLRDDSGMMLDWYERDRRGADGGRDFAEVQTLAVMQLFGGWKSDQPEPFDLKEWGPFLTRMLGVEKSAGGVLDEVSLRLLGEAGYEPALAVMTETEKDARERVRMEYALARTKIEFLRQFDAARAAGMIHDWSRATWPDRDLVQWVRNLYFAQAPAAYRRLLEEDLRNEKTGEEVLRESIADLRKRWPGEGNDLLAGLLRHTSPEVVSDAALALLADNPQNSDALRALDRIASDLDVPIPAEAGWFSHFGRERALDYLYSTRAPMPEGFRWDAARLRRQIATEGEDGRMMKNFLTALYVVENQPVSRDEQIAAYRRSLQGRSQPGIDCAREELKALGAGD